MPSSRAIMGHGKFRRRVILLTSFPKNLAPSDIRCFQKIIENRGVWNNSPISPVIFLLNPLQNFPRTVAETLHKLCGSDTVLYTVVTSPGSPRLGVHSLQKESAGGYPEPTGNHPGLPLPPIGGGDEEGGSGSPQPPPSGPLLALLSVVRSSLRAIHRPPLQQRT